MPAIAVFKILPQYDYDNDGNLYVTGKCRYAGQSVSAGDIDWATSVPINALAATINAALVDAAVQAVFDMDAVTIGILDKKTIIGGAVGL